MDVNDLQKTDDSARREARRRKILENSKSRLSRITGRDHTEEDDEKTGVESAPQENVIYPDPEVERDVFVPQTLPIPPGLLRDVDGMPSFDDHNQFFELFNSLQQQQQQQNAGNASGNMNNFAAFAQFGSFDGSGSNPFFENINNHDIPKVPETRLQRFLKSKVHIGLLALLTYLLISIASFRWNIFLIFLAWEMAEIFILRQYESNSNGIVNVLFVLAGMSPTKVNVILKWIQLLNKVLRDVALFMFVFVVAHMIRAYGNGLSLVPLIENTTKNHLPNVMEDDVFERFDL